MSCVVEEAGEIEVLGIDEVRNFGDMRRTLSIYVSCISRHFSILFENSIHLMSTRG